MSDNNQSIKENIEDTNDNKMEETNASEQFETTSEQFEREEINLLEEKLEQAKDEVLRSLAENQNLRRRMKKELEEAYQFSVSKFAKELIEVADNFDRAIELVTEEMKSSASVKNFIEGIELTHKALLKVFESFNIQKIHPLSEKFDHNKHQALFEVESTEKEPGTVAQVVQPGYMISDRLLRPAMVGVAKK